MAPSRLRWCWGRLAPRVPVVFHTARLAARRSARSTAVPEGNRRVMGDNSSSGDWPGGPVGTRSPIRARVTLAGRRCVATGAAKVQTCTLLRSIWPRPSTMLSAPPGSRATMPPAGPARASTAARSITNAIAPQARSEDPQATAIRAAASLAHAKFDLTLWARSTGSTARASTSCSAPRAQEPTNHVAAWWK